MRNFIVVLFFGWIMATSLASANANAPDANTADMAIDRDTPDRAENCQLNPFASGCMFFGLGPVLTSDGNQMIYGVASNFGYFVFNRFSVGVHASALFSSAYNLYGVGPGAAYYIGPYGGWLFSIGYSITKDYFRGAVNVDGISYGPSISAMRQLVGRVFMGIAVSYSTFEIPGYKSSDWNWSPVIFIPF